MIKDQLALKISLAMHKAPHARNESSNSFLNTYKCLRNYFQHLSMADIAGIACHYGLNTVEEK